VIVLPDGVAYQSKDILFKILSRNFPSSFLSVYGLGLPKIKKVLPSNLPEIKADEIESDGIFLLENDAISIVEYESKVSIENLLKYGNYAFRVIQQYKLTDHKIYNVVIVVIYTGDIEAAPDTLDLDSLKIKVKQVFLKKYNGEAIFEAVKSKIEAGIPLTEDETIQFIISPLTKIKIDRQRFIQDCITLAKKIQDEEKRLFVIAAIAVAVDKFVDRAYIQNVKGWLKMTKLAQLYEEEKIDAVKANTKAVAKNLLLMNLDVLNVMKATKLSPEEIEDIQRELKIAE
jgi:uncharacterized protein (DUF2267 family)